MEERRKQDLTAEADGIIEGRNAVIEALRAGETIDKIYLQKGETDKTLGHIASKARAAGVVVVEADRRKLDAMSRTHAHQGVIALAAVREYISVESILQAARDKGEAPLLVVCDEISDPHNLGAIIRSAECAGAHGVIIPKRRSAGLTAVVVWWLAMGLLGLAWMALWLRVDPQRRSDHAGKVPFAPAIVCAAVVAVIATTLL